MFLSGSELSGLLGNKLMSNRVLFGILIITLLISGCAQPAEETPVEESPWTTISPNPTVTFRVTVPETTPPEDIVYVNIGQSYPMERIGKNLWQATITLDWYPEPWNYFYSRGNLGHETGEEFLGLTGQWEERIRKVEVTDGMLVEDKVEKWKWLPNEPIKVDLIDPSGTIIQPRVDGEELQIGGALSDWWSPSFSNLIELTMDELQEMGATYVMISPTWVLTERGGLPVIWDECGYCHYDLEALQKHIEEAHERGLGVVFGLHLSFDERVTIDVSSKPKEWVDAYFDLKEKFIREMGKMGEQTNLEVMIITGDSDLDIARIDYPGNSDEIVRQRIKGLVQAARDVYSGKLAYERVIFSPDRLDSFDTNDFNYFTSGMAIDLTDKTDPSVDELESAISQYLDITLGLTYEATGKPTFIEAVPFSSIDGGNRFMDISQRGLHLGAGSDPYDPAFDYDFQEQVDIYNALMRSIAQRPWVVGFYTFGYTYIDMVDNSANIRAKPAADQLKLWLEMIE